VLIFVSDLHLRPGARAHLGRAEQFARFWERIDRRRYGQAAKLCLVGDVFDLVRANDWQNGALRPYHDPSGLEPPVVDLVTRTIAAEQDFFAAVRSKVEQGALEVLYVVGNHDRLLHHAPRARAAVRAAFGMPGGESPFPSEARFPEYGVLAYHGHVADRLCHDPDGGAPISDMIAAELIIRFPAEIRRALSIDHPRLDDIDDVRPIVAVPTWVRTLARTEEHRFGSDIGRVWARLVEEFLENRHVKEWFKAHHQRLRVDFAQRVKLLLQLSSRRNPREDSRLHTLHDLFFKLFEGRFARAGLKALERPENQGLRYVVNGHTHFAAMTPLGMVGDRQACYFNIGTWRPIHQLGNVARKSPAFLAYDAMAYLAFFNPNDSLGREFEWWQGAVASRAKE